MSIDKYLKQINLTDYYITKNICSLIERKDSKIFILNNMFLLGYNNKNFKNSLEILFENRKYIIIKELINYNYNILDYKNTNENNLLMMIILDDYFYNNINEIINNLPIDFLLKIITDKNIKNENFITIILNLINNNINFINFEDTNFIKIINIIKSIYALDKDDYIKLITYICRIINNEKIILYIFQFLEIKNIEINYDEYHLSSVDYLIIKNYFQALNYLIENSSYINFLNLDDNLLLKLFNENTILNSEYILNIIFGILKISNLDKIKNKWNQNILFLILKLQPINIEILIKYINYFDIYEDDVYGESIFKIIKKVYNKKEFNYIINKYNKKLPKIDDSINIKKLLIKSSTGIINNDLLSIMLFILLFLKKYKIFKIPFYKQNLEYSNKQSILIQSSISDQFINSIIKTFFISFNSFLPLNIVWINKYNYYLDDNLLPWLKNNLDTKIIYIKLTINILNNQTTKHANIIIIDNKNKIVERFEPYGEYNYYNSEDLNIIIKEKLALPLEYKFIFVQPYPGFQSRSEESNKFNRTNTDPLGYCVSWCFLYLEIKIILMEKNLVINAIDLINYYIINKFRKDFKLNIIKNKNLYLTFIRYYSKKLDNEKNTLITNLGLNPIIYYYNNIEKKNLTIIIDKINKSLSQILKIE